MKPTWGSWESPFNTQSQLCFVFLLPLPSLHEPWRTFNPSHFPTCNEVYQANHSYEHPVPNILLTHYSCIRHIIWLHALCFFPVNKLSFLRLLLKLHSVAISTPGRTDLAKHKVGKNKMCEPMSWEKKRHPVFCKDSTEWAFLTIFIYAGISTLP